MISAKEYFEKYLTWKRSDSNLRTASFSYESYASLDLQTLQQEAQQDNPSAQEELGERYLFGLNGLDTDPSKAKELFAQAAAQGHPDAMHMLADIHRTDEYGMLDYEQYFSLLKQAAEQGSWKSMFNLSCAYYKGKDAYEGHGPEADPTAALNWSMRCSVMTMNLLDLFFTNRCSNGFTDYLDGVFALFIQSICVSARQLIRGDGVPKNIKRAKAMLEDAQSFYKHYFKADCSDFRSLLQHCNE